MRLARAVRACQPPVLRLRLLSAGALGKSRGWGTNLMRIELLPREVKAEIEATRIPISHGLVLAGVREQPAVLQLLVKASLSGQVSTRALRRMAERAASEGVTAAGAARPRKIELSKRSWVRLEPLRGGVRAELHIDAGYPEGHRPQARRRARQIRSVTGSPAQRRHQMPVHSGTRVQRSRRTPAGICPPDSTPPEARNFLALERGRARTAVLVAQLDGGAAASERAAARAFFHAAGVIATRSARVKVPRASRGSTSARYSAGLMSFKAQVPSTE